VKLLDVSAVFKLALGRLEQARRKFALLAEFSSAAVLLGLEALAGTDAALGLGSARF